MTHNKPELIVILGPTASGKTAAAIELARVLKGAVISADSRQVYTDMNIGTAKPQISNRSNGQEPHSILTADVIEGVEHYLINIRKPNNEMTLTEWQTAAYQTIDAVAAKEERPILAGGTMLYIDSIVRAFSIPAVPPNSPLRQELTTIDTTELYERLIEQDPACATFVEKKNTRRIIRALEVIAATGRPFSEQRKQGDCLYIVKIYGLFPGWEKLEQQLTVRAQSMVDEGLREEKLWLSNHYGQELPLLRTINYDQVPNIPEMVRSNLQYARRQMAWWRRRTEIIWCDEVEALIKKATT
jgi:tRNA dimethylallyltransferase